MFRLWKAPVIAALAILTLAPIASAQPQQQRVIVRRIIIVPTYDPFYDPFFYYPYRSVYYPPTMGEVKLKTDMKAASVYVDGGYTGNVKKLKKFSLPPGTHRIELRDVEGRTIAHETVQVLVGKTVTLDFRG